ncbi:hypothetical protein [Streptomyces werraensis]|uniref:hypothetical protein n=1 Tax=Streptomyces werraensis TaxID=68284 RepID=UPI0037D57C11
MAPTDETTQGKPNGHQLEFPPLRNGLDYLESAVLHLTGVDVTARDVKYAVLHLHAGTEVLLKAILVDEHWSLAFDDPGRATWDRYQSGNFKSCTVDDALARLRNIADVPISDDDMKAVRALTRDRNALQHFGLVHNATAMEARAAAVLDFLLTTVLSDSSVVMRCGEEERRSLDRIRSGLGHIRVFVKQRMNRLAAQLADAEGVLLHCVSCTTRAAVDEHSRKRAHCLFCDHVMEGADYEIATHLADGPC